MEERSVQEALETFRLYSEDSLSGVTCILRPDGRYEVIRSTGGVTGKAATTVAARERCHEEAKDYFRYRNVIYRIEGAEKELAKLRCILT